VALTGQRLAAPDLLYTGLATHYVPSKRLPELEKALIEATGMVTDKDDDVVADVLTNFHESIPTSECLLSKNQSAIEFFFDYSTCEEIFDSLEQQQTHQGYDEFAVHTLRTLQKMSPTSMKVTLEGLKRGSSVSSIGEDLQMEYRMARAATLKGADFFEGVRSVLVDKDYAPHWNPATIHTVSKERVEEFFAPIANEWPIPDDSAVSSKL
jgi:enoyl-CoA hydratase/carnithine racemase